MARYITLRSISNQEHGFLQRLLWTSLGTLLVTGLAFVLLIATRPVPARIGRKLLAVPLILAVLAVEGLLYYWRRHYIHKKVIQQTAPLMLGVLTSIMLGLGILGFLYTLVTLSR